MNGIPALMIRNPCQAVVNIFPLGTILVFRLSWQQLPASNDCREAVECGPRRPKTKPEPGWRRKGNAKPNSDLNAERGLENVTG